MWWRLLIAAAAVVILLCLGALEIVAEHTLVLPDPARPGTNADEPERSWEHQ